MESNAMFEPEEQKTFRHVLVGEDGYLTYVGDGAKEGAILVEMPPEGIGLNWMDCYRLVDGAFVLDEEKKAGRQEAIWHFAEDEKRQAIQIPIALGIMAQGVQDEAVMMQIADLYPAWETLVEQKRHCAAGTICKYEVNTDGETQLYSFVQDYVPVAHYTPDSDPTHYKKIGFAEDGHAIWTQPYGESDAYRVGDVRWHKGMLWECVDADANGNNTWEPGVFGWKKVEG